MTSQFMRAAAAAVATVAVALSTQAAQAAPADLDLSFGDRGVARLAAPGAQTARSLSAQPDGKLLIAGASDSDALLARLNADGSVDKTFGTEGVRPINSGGNEVARASVALPDGRIVVVGDTSVANDAAVYRLTASGLPDGGFDNDGALGIDNGGDEIATDVALDRDGNYVVAGVTNKKGREAVVHRVLAEGELDRRFGGGTGTQIITPTVEDAAQAVALRPDGKIIVAGTTNNDAVVYRLLQNGSPDSSFGQNGVQTIDHGGADTALDVALQADGKIVVAGETTNGDNGFVSRLNENGSPDGSFRADPINAGDSDTIASVAIQQDGKVVAAGTTSGQGALAVRLNPNGTRDGTFGRDGIRTIANTALDAARGLALRPDGRIVLAGDNTGTDRDVVAIRLQGGGAGGGGRGGAGGKDGAAGDVGRGRPPRRGERIRCAGKLATIVGSRRRDRIKGTRRRDVIVALGGRDSVSGLRGNDVVCGGSGNDVLRGGAGRDRLIGGTGRDRLIGGPGRDFTRP